MLKHRVIGGYVCVFQILFDCDNLFVGLFLELDWKICNGETYRGNKKQTKKNNPRRRPCVRSFKAFGRKILKKKNENVQNIQELCAMTFFQ